MYRAKEKLRPVLQKWPADVRWLLQHTCIGAASLRLNPGLPIASQCQSAWKCLPAESKFFDMTDFGVNPGPSGGVTHQ